MGDNSTAGALRAPVGTVRQPRPELGGVVRLALYRKLLR